jgi:hypothetical protein
VTTKQEIRDYFAKFGRKGGKATASKLTPEQRQASARRASEARWAKQRKLLDEITEGTKALLKTTQASARKARARKAKAATQK